MNTASIALLVVAAFASLTGTVIMLKSLRASPEGFEDADGFHYGHAEGDLVRQPVHALQHQTAA